MTIEVRYYSKSGNTRKIAEAIADAAVVTAKDISVPLPEHVDLLFLGGAIYAGNASKDLQDYVRTLKSSNVSKIVLFSTSMSPEKTLYSVLHTSISRKGIELSRESFHCAGKFLMFARSHPDEDDVEAARDFAKKLINAEKTANA